MYILTTVPFIPLPKISYTASLSPPNLLSTTKMLPLCSFLPSSRSYGLLPFHSAGPVSSGSTHAAAGRAAERTRSLAFGVVANPMVSLCRAGNQDQLSSGSIKIFSGSANPSLSGDIAQELGLLLGKMEIRSGLAGVEVLEPINGCEVFIIQPTACPPVTDSLMELHYMIGACRMGSPRTITAVVPFFGYARMDRKIPGMKWLNDANRVASELVSAGVGRIITCDSRLHGVELQLPLHHVDTQRLLRDHLKAKNLYDLVVVSPNIEAVSIARSFSSDMLTDDAPWAFMNNSIHDREIGELMGNVEGKIAIITDDIIDIYGIHSVEECAALLHHRGARKVYACAPHVLFGTPRIKKVLSSGLFEEVIVTNTVPVSEQDSFTQLTVLSVASLLAEKIWHVHNSC